jgi:uncharacterized protein
MAAEIPEMAVRDDAESLCYEAVIGGEAVGAVVYERAGPRLVILHTIVDPDYRGRGIGTALVRGALDDVRAKGMTLTNYCGFVAGFIAGHPGYADLLDAGHPGHPHGSTR